MNFGQKLKIVRLSLGLTQQEFADKLHTTKQAISRYENSEREPNLKTAKTFSDLLGIDLTLLADDEIYFPVGDRIRQERTTQGYSPTQFSTLMGISESRLSELERNEIYPTMLELSRLCNLLCCDSDWLLGLKWSGERNVPALNDDECTLIEAYRQATEDDKDVIRLILSKYSTSESRQKKTG